MQYCVLLTWYCSEAMIMEVRTRRLYMPISHPWVLRRLSCGKVRVGSLWILSILSVPGNKLENPRGSECVHARRTAPIWLDGASGPRNSGPRLFINLLAEPDSGVRSAAPWQSHIGQGEFLPPKPWGLFSPCSNVPKRCLSGLVQGPDFNFLHRTSWRGPRGWRSIKRMPSAMWWDADL